MSCWYCSSTLVSYTKGGWVAGSSPFTVMTIFTVRNKFAKVMFLHVSVCPRGGLPQCMLGYSPGSRPPGADTPSEQAPPREQAPSHRGDGYCCGRYASYWNAFLFYHWIQWKHSGKTQMAVSGPGFSDLVTNSWDFHEPGKIDNIGIWCCNIYMITKKISN